MRRHERRRERVDRLRTSAARQDDPPKVGTLGDAGRAVDATKAGDAHALVRRDARARPRVAPHRRALRDAALRPSALDELRPRGRRLAAAAVDGRPRGCSAAAGASAQPSSHSQRPGATPAVAAAAGTHRRFTRRRHTPPRTRTRRRDNAGARGRQRRSSSHPRRQSPHRTRSGRAPSAARHSPRSWQRASHRSSSPHASPPNPPATADTIDAIAAARAAAGSECRPARAALESVLADALCLAAAERSGRARGTPHRSARPSRSVAAPTSVAHARCMQTVAVARAAASAARVDCAVGARKARRTLALPITAVPRRRRAARGAAHLEVEQRLVSVPVLSARTAEEQDGTVRVLGAERQR